MQESRKHLWATSGSLYNRTTVLLPWVSECWMQYVLNDIIIKYDNDNNEKSNNTYDIDFYILFIG